MLARKPINMQINEKALAKQHISVQARENKFGLWSIYANLTSAEKAVGRIFLAIVVMVLASVMYQGMYDKQASICAKTENKVILLQQEKSMLELEVTELKSPNRIQKIAVEELGMVAPEEYIYSSSKASKVEKKVVQSNSIIRD